MMSWNRQAPSAAALLGACLALLSASAAAHAQDSYPSRPIQLVVTTAAGGALDMVARAVADRLSASMQQPIVIENQPAGNGSVAAGQFAKAAPDGHTLMMVVDSTVTINPHLYRNLAYDPFNDFAPVSVVTRLPLVLVSSAMVKANDLNELIALLRSSPGKLSYASTGVGTQLHIGMELFKLMTKTDILHVPYRATTTAMADLVSGRIDLALIGLSSAKAQVDGGKLRAYALAAARRSPLLPSVPTSDEAGLPGYEVQSWFGMLAPARTPPGIIARLSRELTQVSTDPRFVAALAPQGMQIVASSPPEMAQSMRDDSKKWGSVIRETGTSINQ
ncbi:MAG: tripartite tricarboxylate transporter substrate binding protein [Hyphomicrobiales bacterium]|nr:tripartite tricarboxylate transporter substrate binding protein [Hyphomicrobiales bacterium]